MYLERWGLHEKPFENTPNPRFYYASQQHQEATARMLYCIRERKGAGVLTGVFGCGKTVVSQVLLDELNQERYRTVIITNPRLSDLDLLRKIAYHLGEERLTMSKADVLIRLEQMTLENAQEGRDTVIVIDEAHVLGPELFEELRLLLNFHERERFLVTVLLFGQLELAKAIIANKPLEQRIGIWSRLEPLSCEETALYISHRLRIAGHVGADSLFTPKARELIYEFTGGIPRRINRLCDICLLTGLTNSIESIDASVVSDEAKGLAV